MKGNRSLLHALTETDHTFTSLMRRASSVRGQPEGSIESSTRKRLPSDAISKQASSKAKQGMPNSNNTSGAFTCSLPPGVLTGAAIILGVVAAEPVRKGNTAKPARALAYLAILRGADSTRTQDRKWADRLRASNNTAYCNVPISSRSSRATAAPSRKKPIFHLGLLASSLRMVAGPGVGEGQGTVDAG
jgi:hypothetical protein